MINVIPLDDKYYIKAFDGNGEAYIRVSDIHTFKRMKNNWAIITSTYTFFTESFDITLYTLYIDPFDKNKDILKFKEVLDTVMI